MKLQKDIGMFNLVVMILWCKNNYLNIIKVQAKRVTIDEYEQLLAEYGCKNNELTRE